MEWMKELWIYTIKNFTLIAMIFFLFVKYNYTLTEFGNYLQLRSLGGDSNFIEEYDASATLS